MNDIGWNWPLNQGGSIEGFNAQGTNYFKAQPMPSLTRESIQNSLDAKDQAKGPKEPVKVTFKVFELPTNQVPGKDILLQHLVLSKKAVENDAEVKFFKKSIELLRQKSITILKISDYGTTGLRGIDKSGLEWESLVLANGQNFKSSNTAGGSFGSGKDAMLALSQLRTIFYATCNNEGGKAVEGVAKLVTHSGENAKQNPSDDDYRATGFFRNDDRQPITDETLFPKFFDRNKNGTDIFVFGFKKTDDWASEIVRSLLENFLVAIKSGLLVVEVGEKTKVNDKTIDQLVDEYYPKDAYIERQFADTYLPMAENGVQVSVDGFEGIGLELFLRKDKHYNKRVDMYRDNGMKIKYFNRFDSFVNFAGVAIIKSVKLNEYLRKLEPPVHNDWQVMRAETPTHAKQVIRSIRSAIQSEVSKLAGDLGDKDHTLKLDVLADNQDQNVVNEPGNGSTSVVVDAAPETDFRQRPLNLLNSQKKFQKKRKGNKNSKHSKAGGNSSGVSRKKQSGDRFRPGTIFLKHVIERGQGKYVLILELNATFKGDLQVDAIGQNGKRYERDIIEATADGEPCNVNKNVINNVDLNSGKHKIYVNIPSAAHVVLGVSPIVKG